MHTQANTSKMIFIEEKIMLYYRLLVPCVWIIFFFTVDLVQFFLLEHQFFYLLLNFFCLLLFIPHPRYTLFFTALLLCIESWAIQGHFGLCLLYLIPITLINRHIHACMYQNNLQLFALSSLFFTLQSLVIETLLLNGTFKINCTLEKFFANIIVISILCYKKDMLCPWWPNNLKKL